MIRRSGARDRRPAPRGPGGGPRPSKRRGVAAVAATTALALLVPVAGIAGSERRPNDRMYDDQWALENTGQMGPDWDEGTPGADINAPKAWGLTTGSKSVVIGLIDQDLDYEAQDLAANVWQSSDKVNKCPAGTHGYHVPSGDCVPNREGGGHGTRMAHVMGAVGDNKTGLAGVNWTTAIMGVTYGSSKNWWTAADAIDWVIRAKKAGVNVRVINASWGDWIGDSQAVEDKIAEAGDHGILFVSGAGNKGKDNDADAEYPCNFGVANQLCVAATDHDDELWVGSSYGAESVDLAAPGENICTGPDSPCTADGTSESTAFVSGAAALILAHEPGLSVSQLKARILDNVRPVDALEGKVATGGVLDVYCAMTDCRADSNSPSSSSSTTSSSSSTTTTTSGSSSSSSTTTTTSGSSSTEPGDDGSSGTGGSGGSTDGSSATGGGTTSGGGGSTADGGTGDGDTDGSGSSTGGSSGGAFWDPTTSGDSGNSGGEGGNGDLSLVTGSDTSGSTGDGTPSDGTATPGTPGGASTAGGDSGGTQATDGEDGSSGMPRQPLAVDRPSADDEAGSPWSATTVTALVAILFLALAARMLYVEATRRLARHR